LQGAGAAAVAGAAGYELGKPNLDNSVYKNPKAVFLIGYLHAAKEYMPRDRETLEINSIIEDYLAYTKGNAMDLHSGSSKFFNDVGAYNRQHKIGRPGYTEVFDDDVEQKKWIQSQGREALNQLKGLAQTKESVNQGVAEGTAGLPDPNNFDSDNDYYDARDAYGQPPADDYEPMGSEGEPSDDWFDESREKVGNMDADAFDDALARLKKLAGAGPLRTVYDPARRVYKNVPHAVQPAQQPKKAR
jgi:hypothetical protein